MRTLLASLGLLIGCTKAQPDPPPNPPPVPAPPKPAFAPPLDAAAPDASDPADAPSIDAQVGTHTFLTVNDFSEQAYFGEGAIATPGLPAYDKSSGTVAVAYADRDGLGTLPNTTIYVLGAKDARKQGTIAVWTQDQSRKQLGEMQGIDSPKLRELMSAIDRKITEIEPKLAKFTPILPACVGSEIPLPDKDGDGEPDMPDGIYHHYCAGNTIWTCGDVVLSYPFRSNDSSVHDKLTMKANGKTTTVATRSWQLPKVQLNSGGEPIKEWIETMNCIHDARVIPGTRQILIELAHECDASGDWCSAGGSTWHVVTAP